MVNILMNKDVLINKYGNKLHFYEFLKWTIYHKIKMAFSLFSIKLL